MSCEAIRYSEREKDLYRYFGVKDEAVILAEKALEALSERFAEIDGIRNINQMKVLKGFHEVNLSESHFAGTTGYGYDDIGRERIEKAFSDIFRTESTILRWQISSGTAAISLALFGVLRPGDTLLAVTGRPYDTLTGVIGIDDNNLHGGSLRDFGVKYRQVDFDSKGNPDHKEIKRALTPDVKAVFIQKSRGYGNRRTLINEEIGEIADTIRSTGSDAVIIVDNCYGEFVETTEPSEYGADLSCGSLIKNPGGGIATSGGYVTGKRELVDLSASRLNAPGVGSHIGPTMGMNRMIALGLYMAPHTVSEAVKSSVFTSRYFSSLGIDADPSPLAPRGDIVQSFDLKEPDKLIKFCQNIQRGSPVDAHVTPMPWPMPGYDCDVIMAAGAFTQGASIEMSCDAPIKPPYRAYFQGGIVFDNVRLAAMMAASSMEFPDDFIQNIEKK